MIDPGNVKMVGIDFMKHLHGRTAQGRSGAELRTPCVICNAPCTQRLLRAVHAGSVLWF